MATNSSRSSNDPYASDAAKNQFVHSVDVSQAIPAGGALAVSALLVPKLADLDRGILIAVSLVGTFALYAWIVKTTPNRYGESLRKWNVTPLNCLVILANVILAALDLSLTR